MPEARRYDEAMRLLIQKAFEEYWNTGGFPEVIGCGRALRIRIHQEYFHTILYRDLVERYNVAYPRAITDLARWLINNIASLYSINRLTGYLKSLGHKVPKSSVANYLEWFEDAYFLFTVRMFDPSYNRSNVNPKKIYCIDHAMVVSVSSGILVNSGHLLENLVFTGLRRIYPEIYYYKTKTGREIDFIIPADGAKKQRRLIQVCESLANPQTRKRELDSLSEAMRELHLKTAILVTRNEEERITVGEATIEVVPAWRFLLELLHEAS